MNTTPQLPVLEGKATVAMTPARAFAFFTESFGAWWPSAYHIGKAEMAEAILEPRQGGRWYERGGGWSTLLELFAETAEKQS